MKIVIVTQVFWNVQSLALGSFLGLFIIHEDIIVDKVDVADLDEVNDNIKRQWYDDLIKDDVRKKC